MSRTMPTPSVLSPRMPSAVNAQLFTAPAAAARGVSDSANAWASSLNGTVTFMPRPPASINARTCGKRVRSAENAAVLDRLARLLGKARVNPRRFAVFDRIADHGVAV